MTTIAQATTENTSAHKTVKIDGLEIRETKNGVVAFINTQYVSSKLIEVMTRILDDDRYMHPDGTRYGHGIFSVIFRIDEVYAKTDDGLEEVPWLWLEGSKTVVCGLKRCVSLAFEQGLDDDKDFEYSECTATWAAVWIQILSGFLHECHHAESFMDDAMAIMTDDKAMQNEETKADEYARLALFELAKTTDIEPALGDVLTAMHDEAFSITSEELATAPEADLTDKEKAWLECQEYLVNNGGTWYMKSEDGKTDDCHLDTFKALMHNISGDDLDDEEWLKETTAPVTPEVSPTPQTHQQPVMQQPVDDGYDEGYDPNMDTYDQYQTESAMPAAQAPTTGFQGAVQGQPVPPQTHQQNQMGQGNPGPIAANTPVAPQPPAGAHGQPNGVDTSAQVGANAYPATTMDATTFQRVVYNLYGKIYNQIFNSCGFNPTHGEGQPFFMQGGKIVEMLELTPEEQTIVHGMECYDANGRIQMNAKVDGWISGRFIDKAQKLPGFSLVMSDMSGRQIRRKFIPQNPWNKDNNGAYKKTALLAQQGTWIMWIIDPEATDKQFATRIMAGKLETNVGGQWQEVVIN